MRTIELTLLSFASEPSPAFVQAIRSFEVERGIPVEARILSWLTARSELNNFALQRNPPDVSEVGTTWLGSLAAMDMLRVFTERDIYYMGGEAAFIPSSWQSGVVEGQCWAIPLFADTRAIYYRRDLLAQAGVDEAIAFTDRENLVVTLAQLQASGVAVPWVAPTCETSTMLQYMASWVWASGGDFMSPDGRRACFGAPEAKEGIYNYFADQLPYLAPAVHRLGDTECINLFCNGKAAMALSGFWMLGAVLHGRATGEVIENLGVATLPMPTFVGGTSLVVWRYSPTWTLDLVAYLVSRGTQARFARELDQLPTRLDMFESPPFTTDARYRVFAHSLERGRSFNVAYMWGMVEDRLVATIDLVWQQLFANPGLDLRALVDDHFDFLARRLNLTLAADV